jgi:hypothetical protein
MLFGFFAIEVQGNQERRKHFKRMEQRKKEGRMKGEN